jgi:hypothetical protein
LRSVTRPAGAGLLAGVANGRVSIAPPAGGHRIALPARIPADQSSLGWSADGRYLATGDGRVWTSAGSDAGRLFEDPPGPWAWSPVADCAVGFAGPGASQVLSVGVVGAPPKQFLAGDIADFTYTPDGQALIAVALSGLTSPLTASFWRVDLRANSLHELAALPAGTCCVNLGGFAPGGRLLWFWGGPGSSVKEDGWPLTALDVSGGGSPIRYGTAAHPTQTLPRPDFVVPCGSRVLAVVGLFRVSSTVTDKRLGYVAPGRLPRYLTLSTRVFFSPACSPGGHFIAALQTAEGASPATARLTLLSDTGRQVGYLGPGGAFMDGGPEWATPGLVFERVARRGGLIRLWFVTPGVAGQSTLVSADSGVAGTWDWSATPPSGRPSG